ncbi:hypothetical protein KSF_067370 [Reticulibacter mediterranei]|uniref:Peptidase C14 caspase domain-containing protein n=1 Tax=Reticulibacter mediterranei TaxID=2778369 RepID=A0A8J3IJH1_9CHLR|nr:caspase family protein [Reticulibacter mediterranei]GHO96689.1 hypothetical protein KSF_067370 [Reticulibacter mediterranei]
MGQNDYAIVVGIAHYPLFHSDLSGPVNDARHFAEWLAASEDQSGGGVPQENIEVVLVPVPDPAHLEVNDDRLSSVEDILAAFEQLREKVQNLHHQGRSEKRLYIYLAGHGFSVDTEQLGIEESVLLMANAQQGFWPHFAGHYCAEWFVKSGLFQEVVLFMDCCRNEPLINFPLSLPAWGVSTSRNRAKKFYGFATKWGRLSRERMIDGMAQGVFTWSLLKALRGDVTDEQGCVTEQELKGSVYHSVRELLADSQAQGGGEFQDPDFDGDDDWIFSQNAAKHPPQATVQIDVGQLDPAMSVTLMDASHTVIGTHMGKDGAWQIQLSPGFYQLQVSATGQKKFFDVTGSNALTISLDGIAAEQHDAITEKVRLVVDAENAATEIFIIDNHFQRVTEGITGGHGQLEVDLEPGIYKVKFVAGFLMQERYVELQAGSSPVLVSAPELSFSTSVPLKETRTTQDYHEESANQASKRIHYEVGIGSQLFVFVRDLAKQGCNDSATGLTLHDLAGNLLVDFTRQGERDIDNPETDHWVGCNVQVDPGAYRLRVQLPGDADNVEILEQIVVTCEGWQTQLFLLRRFFGDLDDCQMLRADVNAASIFMVPIGTGFQPERTGFREAELARQGLLRGRVVLDADELGKMIWRDHRNPMLGLYGAHQLLLAEKPDLDLLRNVTDILYHMIGSHPDVIALDIYLRNLLTNDPVYRYPDYHTTYQAPPMLRSSWNILVRASIMQQEIIRSGSLASFVADSLWGDGTWLTWRRALNALQVPSGEPLDLSVLRFVYPQIMALADSFGHQRMVDFVKEHNLSNLERFLLEYIALSRLSLASESAATDEQAQDWVRENLTIAKLVQALHAPSASIGEATAGLVQKLKLKMF